MALNTPGYLPIHVVIITFNKMSNNFLTSPMLSLMFTVVPQMSFVVEFLFPNQNPLAKGHMWQTLTVQQMEKKAWRF